MKNEVLRILKLVEEGKLSSEEAAELIKEVEGISQEPEKISKPSQKKFIFVQIRSEDGDNVDIRLPLSMANLLKATIPGVISKSAPQMNVEEITNQISAALEELSSTEGDLVNITSSDGSTVRIFVA
ncbi:MAG: hypothetical protein DRP19_00355 [Thermotogae bacterium]|nr:MAG: hypothetical protein DRP19_00355 [Thermotogota bacterium]